MRSGLDPLLLPLGNTHRLLGTVQNGNKQRCKLKRQRHQRKTDPGNSLGSGQSIAAKPDKTTPVVEDHAIDLGYQSYRASVLSEGPTAPDVGQKFLPTVAWCLGVRCPYPAEDVRVAPCDRAEAQRPGFVVIYDLRYKFILTREHHGVTHFNPHEKGA